MMTLGKYALSRNTPGRIITLFKKEPFVNFQSTGSSLLDVNPDALSALMARSSASIPIVFFVAALLRITTSSISTAISSRILRIPDVMSGVI
jgi:hypothetical protein